MFNKFHTITNINENGYQIEINCVMKSLVCKKLMFKVSFTTLFLNELIVGLSYFSGSL